MTTRRSFLASLALAPLVARSYMETPTKALIYNNVVWGNQAVGVGIYTHCTFSDQTILMRGHRFEHCVFHNCTIVLDEESTGHLKNSTLFWDPAPLDVFV